MSLSIYHLQDHADNRSVHTLPIQGTANMTMMYGVEGANFYSNTLDSNRFSHNYTPSHLIMREPSSPPPPQLLPSSSIHLAAAATLAPDDYFKTNTNLSHATAYETTVRTLHQFGKLFVKQDRCLGERHPDRHWYESFVALIGTALSFYPPKTKVTKHKSILNLF
jgi:hypothetical protein